MMTALITGQLEYLEPTGGERDQVRALQNTIQGGEAERSYAQKPCIQNLLKQPSASDKREKALRKTTAADLRYRKNHQKQLPHLRAMFNCLSSSALYGIAIGGFISVFLYCSHFQGWVLCRKYYRKMETRDGTGAVEDKFCLCLVRIFSDRRGSLGRA